MFNKIEFENPEVIKNISNQKCFFVNRSIIQPNKLMKSHFMCFVLATITLTTGCERLFNMPKEVASAIFGFRNKETGIKFDVRKQNTEVMLK